MVSIRTASCNSPRPETSNESLPSDSGDLQRDIAFGLLEQAVADDAAVTLSPSVPASGESLTRKVMVTVGGSIGCASAAR
jgi:hypothetical protein